MTFFEKIKTRLLYIGIAMAGSLVLMACRSNDAVHLQEDAATSRLHTAILGDDGNIFVAGPNSFDTIYYCTSPKAADFYDTCGRGPDNFKALSHSIKKGPILVFNTRVQVTNGLALAIYATIDQKKMDSREIIFSSKADPIKTPPGTFKYCDTTAERLLIEHNRVRAQYRNLKPLRLNDLLCYAAMGQAKYLADENFNYQNYSGDPHNENGTPQDRIMASGYEGNGFTAENYFWNVSDPVTAVDLWMESPPHAATIISSAYDEVGFGVATGSAGTSQWIAAFSHSK